MYKSAGFIHMLLGVQFMDAHSMEVFFVCAYACMGSIIHVSDSCICM